MNDILRLFGAALILIAVITVSWPLNVPLLALAYRINRAQKPLEFEPAQFWLRSAFAALGLGLLSLLVVALANALIVAAELKDLRGVIVLILFLLYLPAGVWLVFWIFALEDPVQALAVFGIYLLLPGLPLLGLHLLFGLGDTLVASVPWLQTLAL